MTKKGTGVTPCEACSLHENLKIEDDPTICAVISPSIFFFFLLNSQIGNFSLSTSVLFS